MEFIVGFNGQTKQTWELVGIVHKNRNAMQAEEDDICGDIDVMGLVMTDDEEDEEETKELECKLRIRVDGKTYDRPIRPPLPHRHQRRARVFEDYWPPKECFNTMSAILASYENNPRGLDSIIARFDQLHDGPSDTWSNIDSFIEWFGEDLARELVVFAIATNGTLRAKFNGLRHRSGFGLPGGGSHRFIGPQNENDDPNNPNYSHNRRYNARRPRRQQRHRQYARGHGFQGGARGTRFECLFD